MRRSTRNVLLGVGSSVVLAALVGGTVLVFGVAGSTFLAVLTGGAVAGYLNGPDSRRMLRSGAMVGAIAGVLFAMVSVGHHHHHHLVVERTSLTASQWDTYVRQAAIVFVLTVLVATFGAGFGNALAYRYRSADWDPEW